MAHARQTHTDRAARAARKGVVVVKPVRMSEKQKGRHTRVEPAAVFQSNFGAMR